MLKVYYLRISGFENFSDNRLLHKVSEETACRVGDYRNVKVRRTKLLGESMVLRLIQELWGLEKPAYRIYKGNHGKPLVESSCPVWFNLSHSGDYIVAAFSDQEVGIDIERKNKARMEVARRFFHPAEILQLESLSGNNRDELFFRYWSVKESFLKYTGNGLSSPLSGFEVHWRDTQAKIFKGGQYLSLRISECPVDSDYSCYVCSESSEDPMLIEFKSFGL